MLLFMLNWISVSFFCLFVISGSDSLQGRDFMNLSQFDYSVSKILNDFYIKFANVPDVKMQIKCSNCISIEALKIKCIDDELVKTDIEMKNKEIQISFPFNITCNDWSYRRNFYSVSGLYSHPGTNDILISWKPPLNYIYHYLVIVMDNSRVHINKILSETSYRVMDLKENSWYQICIASINGMWRTSGFVCIKSLTDFSKIGPVTNVKATAKNYSVSISWSRPEYEYEIPQGFLIYLQGRTNHMCRLYIIKRQLDINPTSQYSCVNTETITSSLSSLEIKDLPSNSEFSIEISQFDSNRPSAIKYLTIKTKGGETTDVVKETDNGKLKKIAFFVGLVNMINTSLPNEHVVFDHLRTNVGNNYNNLTGEFTASVTGVYVFTVMISAQEQHKAAVRLLHNGKHVMNIWSSSYPWATSTSQAILEIEKGDKIWMVYWGESNFLYGYMYSTFSGYLLFELP